jgi:hypothetical protein
VEKNIHLTALRYRWPPGSWDHLPVARAARLFLAVRDMAETEAAALSDLSE